MGDLQYVVNMLRDSIPDGSNKIPVETYVSVRNSVENKIQLVREKHTHVILYPYEFDGTRPLGNCVCFGK
jgi:hypothetical protein